MAAAVATDGTLRAKLNADAAYFDHMLNLIPPKYLVRTQAEEEEASTQWNQFAKVMNATFIIAC